MKLAAAFTILIAIASSSTAQERMNEALRKGIAEEEAGKNPSAAIRHYESVLAQFDDARKTAATALFRMAEAYRKLGKTAEAQASYRRLEQEFGDQNALAVESRKRLSPPVVVPGANANEARQRYRQTLVEKVALAEAKLGDARRQMELGAAGQADLLAANHELLEARKALAEENGERNQVRDLLNQQIHLAQQQLQAEQKKYELGSTSTQRVREAEKAVQDALGELAAFDGGKVR